jgi:hypothetical protein
MEEAAGPGTLSLAKIKPAPFATRIATNSRIAVAPGPVQGVQESLAVVDQLLVAPDVAEAVVGYINNTLHIPAGAIATVFQGLDIPRQDDVVIVKVEGLPHRFDPSQRLPTVFSLSEQLRASDVLRGRPPEFVAPNRVLVPAGLGAGCPYGPPSPAPDVSLAPPPGPSPEVTVIDSGYQDWWTTSTVDTFGRRWGPWGKNPLEAICDLAPVQRAEFLPGGLSLTQLTNNFAGGTLNWQPGTPDVPVTKRKNTLDALAGHANFVAGVIAQFCDFPTLNVWSHNGAYVDGTDDFPVEASVCRSIVKSQQLRATPVVHVGFAFPLHVKGTSAQLANDLLSLVWQKTFDHLPLHPVVVAPAGNEAETNEHYPAALPYTYPKGPFENVVGVASLNPETHQLSNFTNRGKWVRCSAVGEKVQSTFFPAKSVYCEDDRGATARVLKTFGDGWASWNGTSFAAPKVAGAIATRVAAGSAPTGAWTALTHVYGHPVANPNAGIRFTNL